MLLQEFRDLTKHLPGELELLTAGCDTELVWHYQGSVTVDSECTDTGTYVRNYLVPGAIVLFEKSAADEQAFLERLEAVIGELDGAGQEYNLLDVQRFLRTGDRWKSDRTAEELAALLVWSLVGCYGTADPPRHERRTR